MLEQEIKICDKYFKKSHNDSEILKDLMKLIHISRGEIFQIILENEKTYYKRFGVISIFLIISLLLNLVCMILLLL